MGYHGCKLGGYPTNKIEKKSTVSSENKELGDGSKFRTHSQFLLQKRWSMLKLHVSLWNLHMTDIDRDIEIDADLDIDIEIEIECNYPYH